MRVDGVRIDAPAEDVWPWVADPVRILRWNPKMVSVERGGKGPVSLGEPYGVVYEMGGRRSELMAEVIRCESPRDITAGLHPAEVATRFHPSGGGPGVYVEVFRLEARGDHTFVSHFVDLQQAGLPRLARVLFFVLQRIGKPVGQPYLARLKELVEARG